MLSPSAARQRRLLLFAVLGTGVLMLMLRGASRSGRAAGERQMALNLGRRGGRLGGLDRSKPVGRGGKLGAGAGSRKGAAAAGGAAAGLAGGGAGKLPQEQGQQKQQPGRQAEDADRQIIKLAR